MSAGTTKRRWAWCGVLLATALLAGGCWVLRPPTLPGSLGTVASRVRVGMHQDEVVSLIRGSGTDNVDCFYSRGETRDGRPFLCLFDHAFDKLPPPVDIAWGELEIDDDQGRDLVVTLGPGGTVTGTRLRSSIGLEEWRYVIWHRRG